MLIYQPHADSSKRTSWYGGESTQLHYEILNYIDGYWSDQAVRTLGNGIPSGLSEMYAELVDYYNYCQ
jgi:hypothetical protein